MSRNASVAEHWVTVAKADYLEPGELMYVEVDDEPVCLINLEGEIHALNDTCTHEDASLADGTICGDEEMENMLRAFQIIVGGLHSS